MNKLVEEIPLGIISFVVFSASWLLGELRSTTPHLVFHDAYLDDVLNFFRIKKAGDIYPLVVSLFFKSIPIALVVGVFLSFLISSMMLWQFALKHVEEYALIPLWERILIPALNFVGLGP